MFTLPSQTDTFLCFLVDDHRVRAPAVESPPHSEPEEWMPIRPTTPAWWALGILLVAGCGGSGTQGSAEEAGTPADSEAWTGDLEATARLMRPRAGTDDDWRILRQKAGQAWERGWDTIAMGASMERLGRTFIGTAYAAGTLELAGEEAVVVNLQELDCVTFVENVLALAWFIREADPTILDSDEETRTLFRRILARIRYRDGRVDGYSSRLHYFSDWIQDNEARGIVREVTPELGGVEDDRGLDFMSSHPEAYRQLSDPVALEAIRERERYLGRLTRFRIPEEEIPNWVGRIQDGDIIAMTSSLQGLDVAHTGLAVWQDDALHLLHAPLVGDSVQLSDLPLADRVLRLETQDGIRVIRPLEPVPGTLSSSSAVGRRTPS